MQFVSYECKDRIAYITFRRPEKLNALSNEMFEEVAAAIRQFDGDEDAFVGILSGEGRAFSTGSDVGGRLLEAADAGVETRNLPGEHQAIYNPANWKPLIAAVHGYVLGHALNTAFSCELVVAAKGTRFQVTEGALNVPVNGFWALLARRGPDAFATEVALTGRFWTAEEAYRAGLICRVTEEGEHMAAAEELARAILKNAPQATRLLVHARRTLLNETTSRASAFSSAFRWDLSEDYREGVQAKIERREPVFKGR